MTDQAWEGEATPQPKAPEGQGTIDGELLLARMREREDRKESDLWMQGDDGTIAISYFGVGKVAAEIGRTEKYVKEVVATAGFFSSGERDRFDAPDGPGPITWSHYNRIRQIAERNEFDKVWCMIWLAKAAEGGEKGPWSVSVMSSEIRRELQGPQPPAYKQLRHRILASMKVLVDESRAPEKDKKSCRNFLKWAQANSWD